MLNPKNTASKQTAKKPDVSLRVKKATSQSAAPAIPGKDHFKEYRVSPFARRSAVSVRDQNTSEHVQRFGAVKPVSSQNATTSTDTASKPTNSVGEVAGSTSPSNLFQSDGKRWVTLGGQLPIPTRQPKPLEDGDGETKYELFVVSQASDLAKRTFRNLERVNQLCGSPLQIEVIDVLERPDRAIESCVYITPTLIERSSECDRRLVGDLSDIDAVRAFLTDC